MNQHPSPPLSSPASPPPAPSPSPSPAPSVPLPAPEPVLVTGATGRIGRLVVDRLLGSGVPVRALVRRPEGASLPAGVEVVRGDLTEPDGLGPALEGVGAVFLLWTAPPATAAAVIERVAARARRIVFLSSPHRTPHPFFRQPNPMADLHAEIERLIAATSLEATIVRPGMLASNALPWWAATVRAGGPVRWPYGASASAPVDDRDVAAVAAVALTADGHAGGDYVLTGPEPLTHAAQVAAIGEALGRHIPFEELTPDEFRELMAGKAPAQAVEMLLNAWRAAVGPPAHVTTTVADVLGRAPHTFRAWAADHADAFTGGA
ncbi:NAD(P)H-binding protein [Streptomyces sp. NPDC097619]|uniref:SDR family oxidoreductase n=1 Tax=Streptomyces sp. NPDC097619 TaxID=3157228 RepID=UPI003320CC7C